MSGCRECRELNRRQFIRNVGLAAGAVTFADPLLHLVASTYAASSSGTGNLLVLCQLDGGMDALSFLAPFRNSRYLARRPVLGLRDNFVNVLPDHDEYGITMYCPFFSELYNAGHLAIVQQVGYPNGNGSHFESTDIWQYGVRNLANADGTAAPWWERLRKSYFDVPFGVMDVRRIGDPQRYGYPDRTYRQAAQDVFGRMAALKRDRNSHQKAIVNTYNKIVDQGQLVRERTADFESSGDARGDFFRAAQFASADLGTQIVKISYGGFDTHGSQDQANAYLFPTLNQEFQQFVNDMQAIGMWDRTCVVFYSEFGRRNEENASPGTDHGDGGHVIIAGPGVRGGLHGQNVSTSDINKDNLPVYVDYRAVFSSVIRDWLGFNPRPIFRLEGESYDESVGSDLFR